MGVGLDNEQVARELTEIEKQSLSCLGKQPQASEQDVANQCKMSIDSARRALSWLGDKALANIDKKVLQQIKLSSKGEEAHETGTPEDRLLKVLEGQRKISLDALKKTAGLDEAAFNIALGLNKRNAFIVFKEEAGKRIVEVTPVAKEFRGKKSTIATALADVKEGKKVEGNVIDELQKRGLVEQKEITERIYSISAEGKKVISSKGFTQQRTYNILDPVPRIFVGKRQPYIQFLSQMRKKLIALGFKEMVAPLIVQEFYNFDVLFQPQNHPARTWTDTYQLKWPTHGTLPAKHIVKAVKEAHEFGGKTESIGWKYKWSEEIAKKVMPAAHCTAHSARQLVEGVEIPGKYFAISRCYRPDVLDATHLVEFNQMDGFIIDEDINFRHLLGMLKQFAIEVAGAEEVKFIPDYYPFTEPSVQLSAKHPEMGWVEFAGAGIFRPEMTESLGIKEPAIAWGIGLDRLAMFKLGIKDIRYLFTEDLQWLRNAKMVRE